MYIYKRENWTDFQWDAKAVLDKASETYKAIGFLSGRLTAIGFEDLQKASAESLTKSVVASSVIEGVALDMDEVRSSVARRLGINIPDAKEPTHYVDGIVDMTLDAIYHFDQPLTEDRLFGWHSALFPSGRSGIETIIVGAYRTSAMQVVSGSMWRERVHYRAPEAERVADEMASFIRWFNDESVAPSITKSAIAHLWFVSIHPFDDGNGRIARALSDMVLSQMDDAPQRFYSLSMEISKEKQTYYKVLERTQRGQGDITEWLLWYHDCVVNAVKAANSQLSSVLSKVVFWTNHSDVAMSQRQRTLINRFLDDDTVKLTSKNWARLAEVSTDTALRDIKDLEGKGVLKACKGRVRDISYSIIYSTSALPFSQIDISRQDKDFLISVTHNGNHYSDVLSNIDAIRWQQDEVSTDDLAYKYFAYLL